MEEPARPHEHFYVLATSSRLDDRTRVLKQGETFAVFDRSGDMHPVGLGEQGLFHRGTRHLHRLQLLLQRRKPLLLSSTVTDDAVLAVDLSNTDEAEGGRVALPRNTLHVFRSCFVFDGACHVRLRIRNYSLAPVALALSLLFEADFRDIFEVRGVRRKARGTLREPRVASDSVELEYVGLDHVSRRTRVAFSPAPSEVSGGAAHVVVSVPPSGEHVQLVSIACETDRESRETRGYEAASSAYAASLANARSADAAVESSHEELDAWIHRSANDVRMMVTPTRWGPYPYAGVPWFSTVFGRDGLLTAFEYLWVNPDLARGVLAFLAEHQATERDPSRDAEPGKILHELRQGEMAALDEVPFRRYYGSVDSTPLFVALAGAYYERTADLPFVESIWPAIERAIAWMREYGDADGDGFVEYLRRSRHGLVSQGWKDSKDSVF
ncbi:MAG TPA: glycogen debranching N-terminal domain-containing protein, partial [Planctomycetota bacterium]|nr:glycogen debranching N-terminal domain-containing protein [Planctomycetota bacterium]